MEWLSVYLLLACIAHAFMPLDATQSIQLQPDTVGTYTAGIVQVLHNGEWGTVCHGNWYMNDAKVACRQLGFNKTIGPWWWGRGTGRVWLWNMACTGTEASLQSCRHNGWGSVASGCNSHIYDAGVVCDGKTSAGDPNIRLIPDTRLPANTGLQGTGGIVRVFYNNQWGTVCQDLWDRPDAKVACRQLGFTKTVGRWYYGRGTGKVWLYNMRCTGSENTLQSCPHPGWGNVYSSCNTHQYDAGVVCSGYQVRLRGGLNPGEGRIEVMYAGTWGTICDNGFGLNEANVVCRMLGYKMAVTKQSLDKSSYTAWLKDLSCVGTENTIENCTHSTFASQTCPNNKIAGVVCLNGTGNVSLHFGPKNRVIISHYGVNRSICYDGFDKKDAQVICRMNGYDAVDQITYVDSQTLDANFRQVWTLNMTCQGQEKHIQGCNIVWNWKNLPCPSTNYAALTCKTDCGFKLRLVDGVRNNSGRLEIDLCGKWGTVCDKGWDMNASDVACRMLGYPRALKIQKFQQGIAPQPISLYNISCVGCERSLDDCYHPAWGTNVPCDHSRDVGLVCLPRGPPNLSAKVMADGRIEISYYGVNRSICYDGFDKKDARVICRMNGYDDVAYMTPITSQAGNSITQEVWLLDIDCKEEESSIEKCTKVWNWENQNCAQQSNLRAGVVCKNLNESLNVQFRLEDVTTPAPYSGRLTVKYYKIWGNICAKDLKLEDAHVICRMLNFTEALTISHWGKHTGNTSFELVNHCQGTEKAMNACTGVRLEQVNKCEEGNYAGVVCTPKAVVTPTPLPRNVRLTGGSDNTRGRVEVERHKIWGTICNSEWGMREANVVCRMKGFDGAVTAYSSFGEGNGPIWMSGVRCKGKEGNIENCDKDGQEMTTSCNHSMDAGVVCRRYKADISVNFTDPTTKKSYGKLELKVNGTDPGSICGNGWNKEDADVACQMMGFRQALVPISHYGGGLSKIWMSNVSCSKSDTSLKTCNHDGWENNSCPKGHHAGVICERSGVNDKNIGMRLVKVPGTNLSKVEVHYYGVWGAVSANNWDLADAHVACWKNKSGKASAAGKVNNDDKLPILIDNLNCLGSEDSIDECGFKWGLAGPDQTEVAAVACSIDGNGVVDNFPMTPIILPGTGQNKRFGQVEISYENKKYAACGDKWDLKDAHVICKINSYPKGAIAAIRKYTTNTNNKPFLTGFECRGTETGLGDCFRDEIPTNCPGDFIAGVICDTGVPPKTELRLASDNSAMNSGRVEVSYADEWGTICNDGDSQQNARVICRMLGYVDAKSWSSTPKASDQISWLGNLKCKGTEKSITECNPKWGEATCNDDRMLTVTCEKAGPPHFQIDGMDGITDSTVKISFRNVPSDLKSTYQIAVERRPYEERLQSFNTQETPFIFTIVNYTTSVKQKRDSYVTAEVDSSYLHKNNITVGDLTLKQVAKWFTNEPLQPQTPYRVYVRVATESYDKKTKIYGDYSYVAFKTKKVFAKGRAEKLTSSRGGGAVIGMSIVIIMLIAVIICASIWFIKKQRNEETDASDKNQVIEMTDNGDMRTVNDIPEGYYQAPLRDERNEYVTSPDKDKAAYQSLVTRTRIARNKQENESPLYVEIRS